MLKRLLVVAALATTLLAPAAARAAKMTPLEKMQANVAATTGAEHERWTANIELWRLLGDRDATPSAESMVKAKTLLETIRTNVDDVTHLGEKGRWEGNAALWQAVIDHPGTVPDPAMTKEPMAKMRQSIDGIVDREERIRWHANLDLWLARLAKPKH